MMIATDKRCIEAERDDPSEADLAACGGPLRRLQIRAAKALARMDARRHHATKGCASIAQLSRRLGFGYSESRQLAALGYALLRAPELEAHVVSGHVAVESAAELARIFKKPALNPPIDPHEPEAIAARAPWIELAATKPLRPLRRLVRKRIAELENANTPMVEMNLIVKEEALAHFQRARVIASRCKRKTLTDGETLEFLVHQFLQREDPLYRSYLSGKVNTRHSLRHGEANTRYLPVEVQCTVRRRAGDMCEALGCDHELWLQFAHITPFARGGRSTTENILLLCSLHHTMFDAGEYVAFDAAALGQSGHDRFEDNPDAASLANVKRSEHQDSNTVDPHAPMVEGLSTRSLRQQPEEGWPPVGVPCGDADPPETLPPETVPPKTVPPETVPPEAVPPETGPPEAVPPEEGPPEEAPPEAIPSSVSPSEPLAWIRHLPPSQWSLL